MASIVNSEYLNLLNELKEKIRLAQIRTVLTINVQMLAVYWEIGQVISSHEKQKGWGAKIVDHLAADLRIEFPKLKGLSPRNLRYMRNFSKAWPELTILQQAAAKLDAESILQQAAAKLPWFHICTLMDRVKDPVAMRFYAEKAVNKGWSRNVMIHHIESDLYAREGKLQHNFPATLPPIQSDLAQESFKDPYKFDFIQLGDEASERDLENALVSNITNFLIELGQHFAYCGRQYRLEKGGEYYYLDLLFYNTKLHAYIVIELKVGDFKPEYVSKMNTYLSIVNDDLRTPGDNPSIGIILCKSKNKVTVEYALRDVNKPIGIAEYELTKAIPENLRGELPSIKDLESELKKEIEVSQKPIEQKLSYLQDLLSRIDREEIKHEKSKEAVLSLFEDFLPRIQDNLKRRLKDILPLFANSDIGVTIDNHPFLFMTSPDLELRLMENDVNKIGITIRLEVCKKAGTKAFSIYKDLYLFLDRYKYQIGTQPQTIWHEELYYKTWTDSEIQDLTDRLAEEIVDDMTMLVERIGK